MLSFQIKAETINKDDHQTSYNVKFFRRTLAASLLKESRLQDKAIKEANERKRKAEEECERLNSKAARIKKRRQELLKREN